MQKQHRPASLRATFLKIQIMLVTLQTSAMKWQGCRKQITLLNKCIHHSITIPQAALSLLFIAAPARLSPYNCCITQSHNAKRAATPPV
jgi:hypothetical protein